MCTATGCQPNCSWQIYQYININISISIYQYQYQYQYQYININININIIPPCPQRKELCAQKMYFECDSLVRLAVTKNSTSYCFVRVLLFAKHSVCKPDTPHWTQTKCYNPKRHFNIYHSVRHVSALRTIIRHYFTRIIESSKTFISLLKIPLGTRKKSFEIYRKFGHASSKWLASPGLDTVRSI
jgi:hypothetical protein